MSSGPAALNRGLEGQSSQRIYLVFITLLAMCTPLQLHIGPVVLTPTRLVLLLVIIPLFIRLLMGKYGKILFVDLLMVAHVGWQIVAIAYNNPAAAVQFIGSNGTEFMGGYLVARCGIRSKEDFVAFIKFFLVLILCMMPFAFIETQTGRPVIPSMLRSIGLQSTRDVLSGPRLGLERAQVVFPHPIHFGLFCSMALALVYLGLADQYSKAKRLFLGVLIFVSTIMSVSSGAVLPLLVQIMLIGWAGLTHRVNRRWIILIAILIPLYLVMEVLSDRPAHIAILSRVTFNSHNVYWRSFIFEYGMQNVWANPIFGLGLREWVRPAFMHSASMDNFWLLNTVRYGIPGFLFLFLAFLGSLFAVMKRDFPVDHPLRQVRLAYALGMVSLTLTLATVHVWGPVYALTMLFLGSGIWLITADVSEEASEPSAQDASGAQARAPNRYTRFPRAT